MSDVNNDAITPSEDLPQGGQPDNKGDAPSSNTNIDATEIARREQQGKKDQAIAERDDNAETLDFLMSRESERERDKVINNFLTENAKKYPQVTAEDLKFANSPEEVEELAVHFQNKYKDLQQKALSDVRDQSNEVLTLAQLKEAEESLAKETRETGRSTFGSWLNKKQSTRR